MVHSGRWKRFCSLLGQKLRVTGYRGISLSSPYADWYTAISKKDAPLIHDAC